MKLISDLTDLFVSFSLLEELSNLFKTNSYLNEMIREYEWSLRKDLMEQYKSKSTCAIFLNKDGNIILCSIEYFPELVPFWYTQKYTHAYKKTFLRLSAQHKNLQLIDFFSKNADRYCLG